MNVSIEAADIIEAGTSFPKEIRIKSQITGNSMFHVDHDTA